jgi:hypothetical protein
MAGSGITHYRWEDIPNEQLKPDLHRRLIPCRRQEQPRTAEDDARATAEKRIERSLATVSA